MGWFPLTEKISSYLLPSKDDGKKFMKSFVNNLTANKCY